MNRPPPGVLVAPLAAHERVGRYEIIARIAAGGMATVYLARARGAGGFEREVALKLTHAHLNETPELAATLLDEGKLAARIRHSNVVSVLDVGEDPHGVFLVMEYIEGDSLAGLARKGAKARRMLPLGVGMRVLIDALAGLHASHELRGDDGESLGLVHRDFSPQNIMVGTDGVAKLTDFGIAKASSRLGQTATGVVKGKVSYMAPEQARGHAVDRRCDVWAAGIIAWELLAGMRMHGDLDGIAALIRVVSDTPLRLRDVDPEIAPQLDDAVASALTMDVAARCPSAAVLARTLEDAFASVGRLATRDEVAAYVHEIAGEMLAERRAHANATLRDVDAATEPIAITQPTEPMTTLLVDRAAAEGVPEATGLQERTRTETTATADTSTGSGARPTRRRRIATVALAAGALALLVASARMLSGARPDATSIASVSTPPSAVAATPSSAPPPSPAPPLAVSDVPVVAAPPAHVRPPARPTRRAPASTRAPPAAPTPSSLLAPSPYQH